MEKVGQYFQLAIVEVVDKCLFVHSRLDVAIYMKEKFSYTPFEGSYPFICFHLSINIYILFFHTET